uniref:Uncharacterized protein n=1 Tax=Rhizophora mucronata TaxID=61149 RepID=A0A2P2NGP5_RHIMU
MCSFSVLQYKKLHSKESQVRIFLLVAEHASQYPRCGIFTCGYRLILCTCSLYSWLCSRCG